MSQTTKKALAASLKKLLTQKPLDKITIIDIVEDCEVNRQTFYYHFQDIYDLVEWLFSNEAPRVLDGKNTYDTWQQGFRQIFEYILENKTFIKNIYHSISREHLENFLYAKAYGFLIDIIEEKARGISVREEDKAFIAHFYKYAFVGLVLDWIRNGMKEDPEFLIDRLGILLQGNIVSALEKFRADPYTPKSPVKPFAPR